MRFLGLGFAVVSSFGFKQKMASKLRVYQDMKDLGICGGLGTVNLKL